MKHLNTIFATLWLLICANISNGQATIHEKLNTTLNYLHNPYSDYLFYLLYRESPKEYQLDSTINLGKIQTLNQIISLPEMAASSNIKNYNDIYKIVEIYRMSKNRVILKPFPKIVAYSDEMPNYDTLKIILQAGEKHFKHFYKYWQEKVEPDELKNIAAWKTQDSLQQPLKKLQQVSRIKFKSKTLDIGCIAMHLAGSGNYSPPGIYSSIFKKPDLARFIGHEGTHLLLTKYYGRDWHKYKMANKAIKLAIQNGLRANDIEEMLCMFMQTTLSQQCGITDIGKRISNSFTDEKNKQKILIEFENNWTNYLSGSKKYSDIIEFMLINTTSALK
jgi:hypothetical protein